MKILVCNVGSTSLKYQLIDMDDNEKSLCIGKVERVGSQNGIYSHNDINGLNFKKEMPISNHGIAIEYMIETLKKGLIKSLEEISCIGFKVVHAKGVSGVQELNENVLKAMADFNSIAPAHNPPYISAIRQFKKIVPTIPLIGSFETGFHQTMEPKAYLYPIDRNISEKYSIRRYGFHGASHEYLANKVSEYMGKKKIKVITCHLGGSASICAINDGKSVDTTLGFSLQCGIMHNNRCGDIDPYIIFYLMDEAKMSEDEIKLMLNKNSGLYGMSHISNDLRDIEIEASKGNIDAINTIEKYCYDITKYIGAYIASLGGVDAIVFSGGIGENSSLVREKVLENLEFLGIKIDKDLNRFAKCDAKISSKDSKVEIYIIATNEEIIIARKAKEYLLSSK
ncbi:MAG: acetate/propionate family kinase [Erysipelotrichales bacterium]|nr:acetate/propionate family kinase [Erysipelotrichales bacterium]